MSIEWGDYEIYHPGVLGPLETLARVDARKAYRKLMEAKPARIEGLRRLLAVNGVRLGTSRTEVQAVNDWFRENVAADPDKPGRLLPDWYSVVNDVALFLGDVMIARNPGLHWEFFTWGKKNASYQRHVIMGFSKSPNPKVNVDVDGGLAVYGHRIINGKSVEPDAFWRWIEDVDKRA